MTSVFSALEESLSPAARHALGAYQAGFYLGDPTMTVRELRGMIVRIFGKEVDRELEAHLDARRQAVIPKTIP